MQGYIGNVWIDDEGIEEISLSNFLKYFLSQVYYKFCYRLGNKYVFNCSIDDFSVFY